MTWALANWKLLLTAATVAVLLFLLANARGDARHWEKTATQTQAALDQTVAQYRIASEIAAKEDAQNVVRVKAEQAAITQETEHAYQEKLADSASRYELLRAKASGYLGRAPAAGLPDTRDTTCLAVANTRCDELPGLLNEAQKNTDQLVALQDWVRGQAAIDVEGKQLELAAGIEPASRPYKGRILPLNEASALGWLRP